MIKQLLLFSFLLTTDLSAQVEVVPEPPIVVPEPAYKAGKTRFGRYRTGVPQHVNEGYKTGWALDDSLLVPIEFYKMPNVYSNFMVVHNYEGAWGVIDKRGRTVLPFEYDQGGQLYQWKAGDPVCFLSKNGRQQYFDQQGKVLFETHFEALDLEATNRLGLTQPGLLVATKMDPVLGEISAIADRSGHLLFPFKYYRMEWATPGLVCITEGQEGKHGVRDWNDREIVPLQYMELAPPDVNGCLAASLALDKKGLIDTSGRILIPFEYQECSRRYDVVSCYDLKKGSFFGVSDRNGRIFIPVDAPSRPAAVPVHSIRWERAAAGLRMTRKEQVKGTFWTRKMSENESALYHTQRGLLFAGAFTHVLALQDDGPVLAYMKNGQQQLYDLEGRDLLGGACHTIIPHEFHTCIFADKGDKQWQIHALDGALLAAGLSQAPQFLSHGFFAGQDSTSRVALFDPFGKRLTEHRFSSIQNAERDATESVRKKGTLQPDRSIVARGMIEIPEKQMTTWVYIDQTGEILR